MRARASRGPDAVETSLKTYNPVDETLEASYVKVMERKVVQGVTVYGCISAGILKSRARYKKREDTARITQAV